MGIVLLLTVARRLGLDRRIVISRSAVSLTRFSRSAAVSALIPSVAVPVRSALAPSVTVPVRAALTLHSAVAVPALVPAVTVPVRALTLIPSVAVSVRTLALIPSIAVSALIPTITVAVRAALIPSVAVSALISSVTVPVRALTSPVAVPALAPHIPPRCRACLMRLARRSCLACRAASRFRTRLLACRQALCLLRTRLLLCLLRTRLLLRLRHGSGGRSLLGILRAVHRRKLLLRRCRLFTLSAKRPLHHGDLFLTHIG